MKNYLYKISSFLLVTALVTSCKIDPVPDPNNPGTSRISANATLSEIQNVVDGIESGMRDNINFYLDDVSVIGREYYRFSTSDPRFTSDLLGKGAAVLDNNTFYLTNPYGARYRVIRNTYILMDALSNTKAAITDAQKKAGTAYAKTVQAYQLLLVFNLLWDNGIRVDVRDPDKLGAFLNRQQSLDAIMTLLNEAATDLKTATNFPFSTALYPDLPTALSRVNTTAPFLQFNRALAARVAVYKQDWAMANTALTESFFNLNGNLNTGVYHVFSAAGNDQLNPMFFPISSSGETRVTQPSFVTQAEAGDTRLSKAPARANEFQDGLQSSYHFGLYKSNTDPIPIIRNEELILLYAEVKAQTAQFTESANAINKIRNAAGLGNYGGALNTNALITEILKQRRYSLFGEGHRWIDLRRYNLLSTLPIDRTGDDVWTQFPKPANE